MSDKLLDPPCTALGRLPAALVLLLAGASAFSVANVIMRSRCWTPLPVIFPSAWLRSAW